MKRKNCEVIGCDAQAILPYGDKAICSQCWDNHNIGKMDLSNARLWKDQKNPVSAIPVWVRHIIMFIICGLIAYLLVYGVSR